MARQTMPFRNPAGHAGLINNLLSLAGGFAEFFANRLSLVAYESKSALVHVVVLLGCLVTAGALVLGGYAFLMISLVAAIAHALRISWVWIALGAAGLHFILEAALLLLAAMRLKKPIFEMTREELKKDRKWLKELDKKEQSAS